MVANTKDPVMAHLQKTLQHMENVRTRCEMLGLRLIERGEPDFGVRLISLGREHDLSKLKGIEWDALDAMTKSEHPELFGAALEQHHLDNPHHPEHWGTIHDMPRVYVAEMVCDWAARSSEFGSSFWAYVEGQAMAKFGFTDQDEVYREIKDFADLLLEKAFA
jgi:hypothetical protein